MSRGKSKEKFSSDPRWKARRLLEFSLAKQPQQPLVLDLRGLNLIWDYFIIVTASAPAHSEAITEELVEKSRREGILIHHIEKDFEGGWTLIDYFDVVFHIFSEEKRDFYRLDRLFKGAKKVNFRFKNT